MTFASLEYLIFLPIVFLLYWFVFDKNKTNQNLLIVLASAFFYAWWDIRFLGLLLITALSTFIAGYLIDKYNKKKKVILLTTIGLNLGILFYFKYFNFFLESLQDSISVFGGHLSLTTLKIILPVGISFYTFTALSYVFDVYQKKITPTKDILAYLAYVMFFPSILSGPISMAQKQLPQYFEKRVFCYDNAVKALRMVLLGGGNKVLLG